MNTRLLVVGPLCLLAGCLAAPRSTTAPQPAAALRPAAPRPAAIPQPAAVPRAEGLEQAAPPGPERIAARIRELELELKKGGKADPEGALARELALLYIHPANRSPEPEKALLLLRTYLFRAPLGGEDLEAARLIALLEAIEGRGRQLRDSRKREMELSGAAETFQLREDEAKRREKELLAEIRTLRERIEKLQALDLEMEKRRKSIR